MKVLIEGICRECKPDLFPSGPRQGEHHIGTRFGRADQQLHVRVDGVDRSSYVFETLVRPNGIGIVFIYRGIDGPFEGYKHKCCNCGQDGCSAIVLSRVEVGTGSHVTAD